MLQKLDTYSTWDDWSGGVKTEEGWLRIWKGINDSVTDSRECHLKLDIETKHTHEMVRGVFRCIPHLAGRTSATPGAQRVSYSPSFSSLTVRTRQGSARASMK